MFIDNIERFCEEKDVSVSQFALDIGCSPSAATGWRRGAVPKRATLKKMAQYFGVKVEDLLIGMEQEADAPPLSDRELGRLEGRIAELEKQVEKYKGEFDELQHILFSLKSEILEVSKKLEKCAFDGMSPLLEEVIGDVLNMVDVYDMSPRKDRKMVVRGEYYEAAQEALSPIKKKGRKGTQ